MILTEVLRLPIAHELAQRHANNESAAVEQILHDDGSVHGARQPVFADWRLLEVPTRYKSMA